MKITFDVTVSNDDGSIARSVKNEIRIATDINGVDPYTAKQYCMTQAETLVRNITDNQLPALYQDVLDAGKEEDEEMDEPTEDAHPEVRNKLDKIREKRKDKENNAENNAPAEEAPEPVTCTECGAIIKQADAHFVSMIENGQYSSDAVLCDACYKKNVLQPEEEQE